MDSINPGSGGSPHNEYQKYFDLMNNLNKKNAQNRDSVSSENQQNPMMNNASGQGMHQQAVSLSEPYRSTDQSTQTNAFSNFQTYNRSSAASGQYVSGGAQSMTSTAYQNGGAQPMSSAAYQNGGTQSASSTAYQSSGAQQRSSSLYQNSGANSSASDDYLRSRSSGTASQSGSYRSTQSSSNQKGLYAEYISDGFSQPGGSYRQSVYGQDSPAISNSGAFDRTSNTSTSASDASRYLRGGLGALIGIIPGFALLVFLGNLGYVAALTGIVLFMGSYYLYGILSRNGRDYDKYDFIIISAVCILAVYFGVKTSYVMAIQDALPQYSFHDIYWNLSKWLRLANYSDEYFMDMLLTYVFSAVGAVWFIRRR